MKIYLYALISVVVLWLGNLAGETLQWYQRVPFYDVPMHIFGGFALGLFFIALLRTRRLDVVLWSVVGAGLLWEIFEATVASAGAPFGTKLYILDTLKDFAADIVGAWVAWKVCVSQGK